MLRRSPLIALVLALGGSAALGLAGSSLGACSDPKTNSFGDDGDDDTTPGTQDASTTSGDDTDISPSMAGEDSSVDAVNVDSATPAITAKSLFAGLLPQFESTCGGGGSACHASSTSGAPTWLLGPDQYASLHTYDGMQSGMYKFITTDILSSRFFTKGAHEGPALDPTSSFGKGIQVWLAAENALLASQAAPTTVPIVVVTGPNTIDLSTLAAGTTGAKLTFVASFRGTNGSVLDLGNIQVTAPTNMQLHISEPLFIQVPADDAGPPVSDPDNQFSNVDQTTPATSALGPGTAIFAFTWAAGDRIELSVKTLASLPIVNADAAAGTSLCSAQSSFVTNAVPVLTAAQATGNGNIMCLNCHNTGGSGFGALDLSALGTDNVAACNQVYQKITPGKPTMSPIVTQPTAGNNGHPITLTNPTSFKAGLSTWINAEK